MNINTEIERIFQYAAITARRETPLSQARHIANFQVENADWLHKTLPDFYDEFKPEILALAEAALLALPDLLKVRSDADARRPLVQAIEDLRNALHDIAYERAQEDTP